MSEIPLLALLALFILFLYTYIIHPALLSPLSKLPKAHPTASFSPLWILWNRARASENAAIYASHNKHGSIVRLAPNEISVNCVEGGIRSVYSGGFEKHEWYPNLFGNYGVPNMFSTAPSPPHSARKRMLSNIYSKSHLQSSPHMHTISHTLLFSRFLPILSAASQSNRPVEVHELHFAVTMDFITAYIFGLGNASNFLQDLEERKRWLRLYQSRRTWRFVPQELPTVTALLAKLGLPKWIRAANQEIEAWCLNMCSNAARSLKTISEIPSTTSEVPNTPPIVYTQLHDSLARSPSPNQYPHNLLLASELLDHLAAGHETSGITLTYLLWELSHHPSLQQRLRTEFLSLSPPLTYPTQSSSLPSPRTLDFLPLLNSILLETLRLHAAIPGPQPRITPSPSTILGGYSNLPPNVRVSASAYSLHRNPVVFPEPEDWKPERWLDASEGEREEMSRWFWAFGSGGRMCVGSHFAVQEIKLIVAAIYTNFTTSIVDDTGIEQEDRYTAGPEGNQLVLKFERV